MNIVLDTHGVPDVNSRWFLAGVRRTPEGFCIATRRFTENGQIIRDQSGDVSVSENYFTLKDAENRLRTMVKIKGKKRGYRLAEGYPVLIESYFEHDNIVWVDNEEMMGLIREAMRERYVVFRDVSGLEEYFDDGVPYLATDNGDPETLDVFDRFGSIRSCDKTRFSSVELTEDAKELSQKGKMK